MFLFTMGFSAEKPKPPVAVKITKELAIHGYTRIDPYYWLNDRNDPKVIDYLKAENAYTEAVLRHTEPLQEKIYQEIVGRMKQTDMSVPQIDNGYWYYSRYEQGKNYPLYCRKKGTLKAREEIMLDGNKMADGKPYFAIGEAGVSPDNKLLAYSVDYVSRRQYKIHVKSLGTGKVYPDEITMTSGQVVWGNDNRTFFYATIDDTLRPFRISRHTLGTKSSSDVVVYEEKDSTFNTYLRKSRSEKYVFIICNSTLTTEYRIVDADRPTEAARAFSLRERDLLYQVDHYRDRFFVYTNLEAKNFRLMEATAADTSKEAWRELIPHRQDVLLEGYELFRGHMVLEERKRGLTQIRVIPWGEEDGYYLEFPEQVYTAGTVANPEPDTDLLRYSYNSLTTPSTISDFDMKTKKQALLKREEVVGGYDPAQYESERLFAPAHDGTLIPISLVYKQGTKRGDGSPLLLYAYGSYGSSSDPYFSSSRLSLLDRGFIFAIAHIRGGQEMGRYWYEEGKLFKKINTFTDFIACGEYLVRHGYTNPTKLFAQGGSAGGLLMGAVLNLQPDLFRGVIAAVPFVDVVTTMLDTSIPLTTAEYDEWGNPKDKTYFEYMLSYSPYDNVRAKHYPAILVTTGLHDSQVQYWEPAKWVARLREMKLDDHLLILKTNMEAGHGGASGRFRRQRETALQYVFILDQSGISD